MNLIKGMHKKTKDKLEDELSQEITTLYPTHSVACIASELKEPEKKVCSRVRLLLKYGKLKPRGNNYPTRSEPKTEETEPENTYDYYSITAYAKTPEELQEDEDAANRQQMEDVAKLMEISQKTGRISPECRDMIIETLSNITSIIKKVVCND